MSGTDLTEDPWILKVTHDGGPYMPTKKDAQDLLSEVKRLRRVLADQESAYADLEQAYGVLEQTYLAVTDAHAAAVDLLTGGGK